mgnify:FL=1
MIDILLEEDGDIAVSEVGDISITNSVRQAVLIRLRWIYNEWRLGPELGFPWFEQVFVKNPNTVKIRSLIRDEILQVDGVTGAEVTRVEYDRQNRAATFTYTCSVGEEIFREEVPLYG